MSDDQKAVFDANHPFSFTLQSAGGSKAVTVRFPTDEEWIERQRKRKIIIKQLGRGMSETIVPESDGADTALVAKLRDVTEPEVDDYEAARILDQMAQADVDDVAEDAAGVRIALRVATGITSHVLSMPSAKDIFQYRRAFARVLDLPFNKQQLSINLSAAADLYQKLCKTVMGYAGDIVPIVHKAVVVKAAIDAVETGFGPADQDFFRR